MQQLHCRDLDIWYLRMAAAPDASVLAAGTSKGAVAVWRPRDVDAILTPTYTGEVIRDPEKPRQKTSVLQCDGLRLPEAGTDDSSSALGQGGLSRGAARRKASVIAHQ